MKSNPQNERLKWYKIDIPLQPLLDLNKRELSYLELGDDLIWIWLNKREASGQLWLDY